jgi:hypothetical protein
MMKWICSVRGSFLNSSLHRRQRPKLERCYPVNTTLNGEHVMLELLDSGGHHLEVCVNDKINIGIV